MPRCTSEERASEIPEIVCFCELKDCQIDISTLLHDSNVVIVEQHSSGQILLEEALKQIDLNSNLATAALERCSAKYARCRGEEPLPLRPFTKRQKAGAGIASRRLQNIGFATGVAGLIMMIIPGKAKTAGFSIAVLGFSLAHVSRQINDINHDPIDPNFSDVEQPAPINMPKIVHDEVINELQANTLNNLLKNQANGISLATALGTALNRAQGAAAAGNLDAKNWQLRAARDFALQWANNLMDAPGLRAQAAASLSVLGSDALSVSMKEVLQIRSVITSSGWPNEIDDMLAPLNLIGESRNQFLQEATSSLIDTTAITGNLAGKLIDHDLASQEAEVMDILREFEMARE
jgi:hypothetical protein